MPVTRSQKDAPLTEERSEGNSTLTTSSDYTSEQSTSTETTNTTKTSGETATTTAANQEPEKRTMTLVPAGSTRHARTARTTDTSARRRELEAREELARLELEQARAAARLARVRLEMAQCDDDDSVEEDNPEERDSHIRDWIQSSVIENKISEEPEDKQPATTKEETSKIEVRTLADALKQAFSSQSPPAPQPKYIHELPSFEGNSNEWLAFRVVYEDTAPVFNDTQNMARLRKAIRGNARESIKSLLYSDASPQDIIDALRRRYGRPDALVLAELDKVKTLPKITEEPRDICIFASQVNNSVAAIKGLKKQQYLHSPELVKQIINKMPPILKFRWYDFTAVKEEEDSFSDLTLISEFLNREADKCGAFASMEDSKPAFRSSGNTRRNFRQVTHNINAEEERKKTCPQCDGDHSLIECQSFLKASTEDRWNIVKKSRTCFKCLQGRHRKETCRKPPCKHCRRWHHPLLHVTPQANSSYTSKTEKESTSEKTNEVAIVNMAHTQRALLKMARVEVYGPRGSQKIMALMDEGSTVTLLDSSIAERIGLTGAAQELVIETVGGNHIKKEDSMITNLIVKGVHQTKKKSLQNVRTMDNLRLTPQYLDKRKIEDCRHLQKLSQVLYYEAEPPQLLIGQDNWDFIISLETRRGKPGQPVASRTKLGWVLHGTDSSLTKPVHFINTCLHASVVEDDIHQMVKEHFSIESLGVQQRRPSTDAEGRALALLESTCRRRDDGRFEIGLLWKSEDTVMPESYAAAENRLRSIERKLDKDQHLKSEYNRQMKNLFDNDYAEEAPAKSTSPRKWYLPHFPVVHPLKKKIRIVFDAAAKSKQRSLNDALLSGPDLLQSLFGVLLRFRQGPIAVAADIKEMFLQVKIREEDRDSLRFLWRGDARDTPPKEYRMTSVIFGAASSPCAAIYVKNRNAKDFEEECPDAVTAIEKNHYMDDYLHSFHDAKSCKRIIQQVDSIHKRAGFELRGWASNRPELIKSLKNESQEKTEVNIAESEEKTLGLRWFTTQDEIGFRANLRNTPEEIAQGHKTPTKREVTSAIMSTFDPLGLLSPVLIQGKKLLQRIWKSGIGWDQELEDQDFESWTTYLNHQKILQDLRLQRCIAPSQTEGELHTFTDASETAYAAAVYWRTQDTETGDYQVSLVAAKARVTPLKPVSMPRLELQAALLGSRLACSVEQELNLKTVRKTYWTDSSVVLSWIKTDPRTFKTFVAHRLAEIEDLTKPQEWRWVPTAQNPADDATRDVPRDFNELHRWFTGPAFLREEEVSWPTPRSFKKEDTGEEKSTEKIHHVINEEHTTPAPERFSTWKKLLRTTARVLQFIDSCRRKDRVNACKKKDPAWKSYTKKTPKEHQRQPSTTQSRHFKIIEEETLLRAEKLLIQRSQRESFSKEIHSLKKGNGLDRSSKLKKLDVQYEDGLLRLRGRINAIKGIAHQYLRPMVLDGKNRIAELIIEDHHRRFNHGNHATVMNEIRQQFWIIGLRSTLRKIQHRCQHCRVKKSKPSDLPTGDLPAERLRHGAHPFTCTGVDYFGPMVITVARRHEKRWGALFTCLTTRAVHLELVPTLSTDSMIMALRRFAARRGMPKTLYSDNGTNFVGASKELREALDTMKHEDLVMEAEKIGVLWKFIPPGAPNMGGAWERLVRSVKTALDATLRERYPREEVLHTLLLEAEHMINSRPITNPADNPEEEALTPNHFLIGRSCGAARLGSFADRELVGRDTWKTTQRLADHFWKRWLREYLPTLLPRRISGHPEDASQLKEDDVVLIIDSSLPRCTWPRGRVLRTYPGPDGRVRIVDVETKGGVLRRPASRLVVLVPAESPSQDGGASHEGENVGDRP